MNLYKLHSGIKSIQDNYSIKCQKSNGCDSSCCWIDKMAGEPSVTKGEIELINEYLLDTGGFIFYESGKTACKFLSKYRKCKIYPVRPIDCRVHFCLNEAMESIDNLPIENFVNGYRDNHEADYLDSVLLDSFKFHGE